MVIDMGGGTTDIAVLSLGDIVTSESIRIAGDKMNVDLSNMVKNDHGLMIGERTSEQIKMFLTRLGANSKMVITGDVTQIDLPEKRKSGLIEAMKVLKHVEDIATIRFTEKDVVRHKLVQDIIKAYENYYKEGRTS